MEYSKYTDDFWYIRGQIEETKRKRRSKCPKCGSIDLEWQSWGAYLDKDLVCKQCKYVVDIGDC